MGRISWRPWKEEHPTNVERGESQVLLQLTYLVFDAFLLNNMLFKVTLFFS